MTALDKIRSRRETGKSMDQIQAESNTETMFWIFTVIAAIPFASVWVSKYFWFQEVIHLPNARWEMFQEMASSGITEVFRLGSLIMAFYEAKRGRKISVYFGIMVSLAIMLYDIRVGYFMAERLLYETYVFLCVVGELIAIRAIFGEAFESGIVKQVIETVNPKTEIVKPKPPPKKSANVSMKQGKRKRSRPKKDEEPIQVDGFSEPMTSSEIQRKLKQYEWKLVNGKGRPETAQANITKLKMALAGIGPEDMVNDITYPPGD